MKRFAVCLIGFMLYFPLTVLASELQTLLNIFDTLQKISGFNLDIKHLNQDQLALLKEGLIGSHTYGSQSNDPNQYNWGEKTDNWQTILALYQNKNTGPLAAMMQTYYRAYPMVSMQGLNETENQYYLLQAQTTLASRSSSELAFQQIAKEASVVASLQQEIDKAKDNKSAVDLNNRLMAEQNKLNIQQAKMLALLVQQTAIEGQDRANRAKEDVEFFDYR